MDKCCNTCRNFAKLDKPKERSDGAVIYGYCFKDGDKDYSVTMGKGYPVFIDSGETVCKQYKKVARTADTCTACGEIIPEGRQVCPLCEKEEPMGNKNNPYFNSEGYADPTAFAAISSVTREENAELDSRVNFLIKVIKFIADGAGFDITNRIELRDRKTGKEFK